MKKRNILESRRIASLSTEKTARRAEEKTTQKRVRILAHRNESGMQDIGTEQVRDVVRFSLVITTYAMKDICENYVLKETFNPSELTVSVLNSGVFLQNELETPPGGRSSPLSEMIYPPTTIETLLSFHALRNFDFRTSN